MLRWKNTTNKVHICHFWRHSLNSSGMLHIGHQAIDPEQIQGGFLQKSQCVHCLPPNSDGLQQNVRIRTFRRQNSRVISGSALFSTTYIVERKEGFRKRTPECVATLPVVQGMILVGDGVQRQNNSKGNTILGVRILKKMSIILMPLHFVTHMTSVNSGLFFLTVIQGNGFTGSKIDQDNQWLQKATKQINCRRFFNRVKRSKGSGFKGDTLSSPSFLNEMQVPVGEGRAEGSINHCLSLMVQARLLAPINQS